MKSLSLSLSVHSIDGITQTVFAPLVSELFRMCMRVRLCARDQVLTERDVDDAIKKIARG